LFYAAVQAVGLKINTLNPQYTYMFELVSPYNRVIVPYKEIDLYHIGTRDNTSLREISVDIGVQKPKTYNFGNLNDVIEMAKTLRYCEEGYVVRDKNFNRVKIKSPAYVAVSHMVEGMSDKRLLELIKANETEEFLTYFPEYKTDVDSLLERIKQYSAYVNGVIQDKIEGKTFETRKDFADMAQKTVLPAFLFQYYDGKVKDPLEWLWSLPSDKGLEHINKIVK
jgi:hypothetical protein